VLRRRCAAALALPALVIAGCSSSGGATKTSSPPPPSSTQSTASVTPGSPAAVALAAKIRKGLTGLKSAHLVVNAGSLGGISVGDISYANGAATASDIVLDNGGEKTRIITVGSTSFAKLPKGRNTSGKPWVTVSAASKNEFVRALASSLSLNKAASSLPAVADLAGTASSVTTKSEAQYALIIDPAKSSGTTLGTLLADIGQKTVPVRLTLDRGGRPVAVAITVKLGSQTFAVTVAVSQFNVPVKITAPPAGQVSSG
jgi:hypothetical protein